MFKRKILRGVSFFLLTVMLLCGLSWLLRDRETTLSCLYSEENDSLDVLIVGSSHVNSGYIPSMLWKENGVSACNVFSWSQPMWISYHYILEALKTQNPSVIVLEMYGMMYGHSSIMPEEIDRTSYQNSFNIDPGINFLRMIQTVEFCGLDLRNYEDFLNLPRYHTRWKTPDIKMLTYNPHNDPDPLKGYGLVLTSQAMEKPDFAEQAAYTPYEYCVEYLDKITELCEKKGIDLVFTITPYVYNETEQGILQWIDAYAQEHNIPFLNYNGEDGDRIGFDYSTDLSDWGHLNFYGAQKVTLDLCRFLENYDFPSREEHKNAQLLDEQLNYYERVLAVQPLLTETDFSAWLQAVSEDPNLTVFFLNSSASDTVIQTLNDELSPLGYAADSAAWMLDGGKAIACSNQISYPLFGSNGTVSFDQQNNQILLNQTAAPSHGELFSAVVYDKLFDRPLDSVTIDQDLQLVHREFTSDILSQYR